MGWESLRLLWQAAILLTLGTSIDRSIAVDLGWPGWRGPLGNNHASFSGPIHWNKDLGIIWRVPVPGQGHGSPCISSGRIFLASADEAVPVQFLVAFDCSSGELLWRTDLHHESLPQIHVQNSHASASPVCDGRYVYQVFVTADALWASAVDIDGSLVWQKRLGKYRHANGFGASPVLYQGLLLVCNDNQADPSLTALDCRNGETIWRVDRPLSDNSASPTVALVSGRYQLLINGANAVMAYDPLTGNSLWEVNHNTEVAASTITSDGKNVFASGNVPEPMRICIRADGTGDVSATHVLWKSNKLINYVPSSLVAGEYLFAVTDAGILSCRIGLTDEILWKHRLEGKFFASPILAGENLYVLNEAGTTYVVQAEPEYELVAVNELDETCIATPAFVGDKIFLRTTENLICISNSGNMGQGN